MTAKKEPYDPFDPTGLLREMRSVSMDAWSKLMIQFVNSEAYAQATGTILDTWLSSSAPLRKALETSINQTLANLNLPSRDDVARLAEQLTHIEMRLDDMEAKLDQLQKVPPGASG